MKINDFNFAGHRAIARVDLNVPLDEDSHITGEARTRGTSSTPKKVLTDGGAPIMMSHMGKPKSEVEPEPSLSQIVKNVSNILGVEVKFAKNADDAGVETAALKPGEALLFENLRYYPEGEGKSVGVGRGTPGSDATKAEMKERQKGFTKKLVSYTDMYASDTFDTAHRKHASTAVIADYFDADHKILGYLIGKEVTVIDNVLRNAQHSFIAIIGDSKASSKFSVIKDLLDKASSLIIGGDMGYTLIEAQDGKIGKSLHEDDLMPEALNVIATTKEKGVDLLLSVATVCGKDFSNGTERKVFSIDQIPDEWESMDISGESIGARKKIIFASKTILWNGPVDVSELENSAKGTGGIARAAVQAAQENDAYSLVGGGGPATVVNKLGLADKVSYVSTGGGAMLEATEDKVFSGVTIIEG